MHPLFSRQEQQLRPASRLRYQADLQAACALDHAPPTAPLACARRPAPGQVFDPLDGSSNIDCGVSGVHDGAVSCPWAGTQHARLVDNLSLPIRLPHAPPPVRAGRRCQPCHPTPPHPTPPAAAVGTIFGIYKAKDPQAELAGNFTLDDVLRVRWCCMQSAAGLGHCSSMRLHAGRWAAGWVTGACHLVCVPLHAAAVVVLQRRLDILVAVPFWRTTRAAPCHLLVQPGTEMVAAGYCMYGERWRCCVEWAVGNAVLCWTSSSAPLAPCEPRLSRLFGPMRTVTGPVKVFFSTHR